MRLDHLLSKREKPDYRNPTADQGEGESLKPNDRLRGKDDWLKGKRKTSLFGFERAKERVRSEAKKKESMRKSLKGIGQKPLSPKGIGQKPLSLKGIGQKPLNLALETQFSA